MFRNHFMGVNAAGDETTGEKEEKGDKNNRICILCGTLLNKGDKIISDEYKGGVKSIVHVFGCPACYSGKSTVERKCPICKKRLPDKGYLMGKMWTEKGKRRLHIIACTECSGKNRQAGPLNHNNCRGVTM
ncbi:MAG: hypothetical protein MUC95_05855 [Spirochaetes bacterium]|nr:hypothetical protein [Spirochaetota bacterium]